MPRKAPSLKVVAPALVDRPTPPEHLGDDGRRLWEQVQLEYQITDPGGLELLRQAAEAADRIASVRRQIDDQGELLTVRGVPRRPRSAGRRRFRS
jgi:hypothetical protein